MMHALIETGYSFRRDYFPCKLARGERVKCVGECHEIDRLVTLLCEPPVTGETYLYLMRDTRTGLTKIGVSKKPEHRERALQSDNPLIEMFSYTLASRWHERHLHGVYKAHRVRGEWFNLTDEHIAQIQAFMSDQHAQQSDYDSLHDELAEVYYPNKNRTILWYEFTKSRRLQTLVK